MFAKEMGFTVESLSTNKSKTQWKNWTNNKCQPNFRQVSKFLPRKEFKLLQFCVVCKTFIFLF